MKDLLNYVEKVSKDKKLFDTMKNKALFLDRDGVINKDNGYTYRIEDFIFINGIFDLVRKQFSIITL